MSVASFRLAVIAATACIALWAAAATGADTMMTRAADLRADRYVDSAAIRRIDIGTRVELLKTDAGWVQLRVDGATGWVRATSLAGDSAAVASLARLESGRGASNNIVVAAGIRRIPKASRLALIIGVESAGGEGQPPQRWPGVAHDIESARLMAQRMGIPEDNVEIVRGSDAGLRGIEDALDRLAQRVQPGDQVLVYFSGPGTLSLSEPPSAACGGAWVSTDGRSLSAGALAARLKPLFTNADKVMVVSDAAYSAPAAGGRPTPNPAKKFLPIAAASSCVPPVEGAAMPLVDAAYRAGAPTSNLVHVQSAVGALQGLDQALAGGIFTQTFADCLMGDATDADRSGSITVAELAACTNRRGIVPGAGTAGAKPEAVAMVTGNAGFSPTPGVTGTVATPASGDLNAGATPPASGTSAIAQSPRAALDDVLAQRDGRVRVELTATPSTLQIGKDFLDLRLTSSHAGVVYVILLGSDEKSFYLLFPNDLDRNNRIAAGETLQLPRLHWRVQSQGPPGRNVVLAVVAESERDLKPLDGNKSGPFSTLLTDTQGRAQLQWLLGRSSEADTERCLAAGSKRNLAAIRVCSDAFGAARVDVMER
ncbi:MAG: DUF4384 domain-containing protein [Aromatoleum sp.]|nr:DUF4384 domain-containing protein [Aromatoleum sp.]